MSSDEWNRTPGCIREGVMEAYGRLHEGDGLQQGLLHLQVSLERLTWLMAVIMQTPINMA